MYVYNMFTKKKKNETGLGPGRKKTDYNEYARERMFVVIYIIPTYIYHTFMYRYEM